MSSEKLRIHTAMPPETAESETATHARRRIFAQDKASSRRAHAQKDAPDSARRVHVQKDETNSARHVYVQKDEVSSVRRVHAQKDKPGSAQPIHWRCLPHPLQRRGLRRAGLPRPKLSAGDRMLRNTAVACALLRLRTPAKEALVALGEKLVAADRAANLTLAMRVGALSQCALMYAVKTPNVGVWRACEV